MKVKVLIAKGFEETEAIAIIDILRRANYDLKTVSITGTNEVEGGHKIMIITDSIFENENFDDTDLIFIPGGSAGVENLLKDNRVINLIKDFNNKNKYIAAICAGPKLLDKAAILADKTITCYPSVEKEIFKAKKIVQDKVVVDKNIITSRAMGTAIDMGLKLVEIFSSKKVSDDIKNKIVY